MNGGAGLDTATYAASGAGVNVSLMTGTASGGDAEGDTLISIERLTGSASDDTLEGNGGTNVLTGGSGIDTVSYEHATAGGNGQSCDDDPQNTVGAGSDTLSGFENLTGSQFDDTLTGTAAPTRLSAEPGNDKIAGGGGADTFTGGMGRRYIRFQGDGGQRSRACPLSLPTS